MWEKKITRGGGGGRKKAKQILLGGNFHRKWGEKETKKKRRRAQGVKKNKTPQVHWKKNLRRKFKLPKCGKEY